MNFHAVNQGHRDTSILTGQHLLTAGRRILWLGATNCFHRATIVETRPGIAFLVKDEETGRNGEIYIEQIRAIGMTDDEPRVFPY